MSAILRALRSPGAMREVVGVAPSQMPSQKAEEKLEISVASEIPISLQAAPGSIDAGYHSKVKSGALDRGLDHIVKASGSAPVFVFIQLALLVWALLGIHFHGSYIWPIIISDAQAIFSYIFDSFLMRQQLNGYYEGLTVAAELQSRGRSVRRMLKQVHGYLRSNHIEPQAVVMQEVETVQIGMPKEDWFGRFITLLSTVVGNGLFVVFYWACIFFWLGFGPTNGWSSTSSPASKWSWLRKLLTRIPSRPVATRH